MMTSKSYVLEAHQMGGNKVAMASYIPWDNCPQHDNQLSTAIPARLEGIARVFLS